MLSSIHHMQQSKIAASESGFMRCTWKPSRLAFSLVAWCMFSADLTDCPFRMRPTQISIAEVPSHFLTLERLPTLATQKVDLKCLQATRSSALLQVSSDPL